MVIWKLWIVPGWFRYMCSDLTQSGFQSYFSVFSPNSTDCTHGVDWAGSALYRTDFCFFSFYSVSAYVWIWNTKYRHSVNIWTQTGICFSPLALCLNFIWKCATFKNLLCVWSNTPLGLDVFLGWAFLLLFKKGSHFSNVKWNAFWNWLIDYLKFRSFFSEKE